MKSGFGHIDGRLQERLRQEPMATPGISVERKGFLQMWNCCSGISLCQQQIPQRDLRAEVLRKDSDRRLKMLLRAFRILQREKIDCGDVMNVWVGRGVLERILDVGFCRRGEIGV